MSFLSTSKPSSSGRFSLDKSDWHKLGKNLLFSFVTAVILWLSSSAMPLVENTFKDNPTIVLIAQGVGMIVLNMLNKIVRDNSKNRNTFA